MVTRRIELRSYKGSNSDDSDGPINAKDIGRKYMKFGNSLYWVIGIIIGLFIYNCYGAYQEQITFQDEEKEEAKNCMYQFKTQDCNPLNLTDKCK